MTPTVRVLTTQKSHNLTRAGFISFQTYMTLPVAGPYGKRLLLSTWTNPKGPLGTQHFQAPCSGSTTTCSKLHLRTQPGTLISDFKAILFLISHANITPLTTLLEPLPWISKPLTFLLVVGFNKRFQAMVYILFFFREKKEMEQFLVPFLFAFLGARANI